MPRDVEALKAYMRDGYMKLNPDAEPEEVDAFIQVKLMNTKQMVVE